jgi:hypothetical protein
LCILLTGTGLVPRTTGESAFTLVPDAPNPTSTAAHTPRYPQYSAALQAAVTNFRTVAEIGELTDDSLSVFRSRY